jgi:phosphoribosylglycinamide formyltransferase-1
MTKKFRIGIFTSAWDEVAWDLVETVAESVRTGFIPNSEIAFVFVSRTWGETKFGDLMIENASAAGLPVITFSSCWFRPQIRQIAREKEKEGDSSAIEAWREAHDKEILRAIPETDIDIALGWMWWFSPKMCAARKIINLHPALPNGPKGTYKDVIWGLIRTQAWESGVMMHLITPELDRGPAISFCRYPIRGDKFDELWEAESQGLAGEKNEKNLLFAAIRETGVIREFPMVLWTINSIAAGKIRIENGTIMDDNRMALPNGHDLTQEINSFIASTIILKSGHICDNHLPPNVLKEH